ncbi:MAG: hypothetical protein II770_01380 [Bacteroidales bacterium]|nr:hypothetical protein [Bacteroidales bacterium]
MPAVLKGENVFSAHFQALAGPGVLLFPEENGAFEVFLEVDICLGIC